MKGKQKPEAFKPGEWYPFNTIPSDYWTPIHGPFGKMFRARQGECAPYEAWFMDGRFQPVQYNGSYRPTHWSPRE